MTRDEVIEALQVMSGGAHNDYGAEVLEEAIKLLSDNTWGPVLGSWPYPDS